MIHKKSYLMILILMILSLLIIAVMPNYSIGLTDQGGGVAGGTSGETTGSSNGSKTQSGTINPDDFDPSKSDKDIGINTIATKAGTIVGIIRVIGTVASVIVLAVLGIKYMIGSTSEKAEYKKSMIPYLIGAIMLFAIPHFLQIIYSFTSSVF